MVINELGHAGTLWQFEHLTHQPTAPPGEEPTPHRPSARGNSPSRARPEEYPVNDMAEHPEPRAQRDRMPPRTLS
ncbi:hypothetical protein CZ774_06735 [Frigoribacterium sp. JB110]|nr:hypothetical protein CZ774_06735 [Frigoribacterium sp. JB110]